MSHISVRLDDDTARELQALIDWAGDQPFVHKMTPSVIVRTAIHNMYLELAERPQTGMPRSTDGRRGRTAPAR